MSLMAVIHLGLKAFCLCMNIAFVKGCFQIEKKFLNSKKQSRVKMTLLFNTLYSVINYTLILLRFFTDISNTPTETISAIR